jgi:tripartite ATP-independent transporter DctM subunit
MDPVTIGIISLGFIFIAVLLGLHIGVALPLISLGALALIKGDLSMPIAMLASGAFHGVMDYVFSVVPMFLLMGFLANFSGSAEDAYDLAVRLLGKLRGSLAIATVIANAVFAAITGVSIASAALFSKMSLPHMLQHGYDKRLSLGTVAGSSVLGMLIPPSFLLILYGILANQSIGALYIAGIVPGIILASIYIVGIIIMIRLRPHLVKEIVSSNKGSGFSDMSMLTITKKAIPIAALVIPVLGGIYIGIFTPTEAGAVGAFIALVIGVLNRRLTLRSFLGSLLNTSYITTAILFILVGAQIYSRMLTISRVPNFICEFGLSLSLPPILIVIFFMIVIILMGAFLDSTSILLITMPIMVPVVRALGYDLIWYGIVTIVAVEVGMITPPFGMVVFTMNAALGGEADIETIFRAAFPFVVMMLVTIALLISVPVLSTWLPDVAGLRR